MNHPALKIIDDGSARQDLAERQEVKYVFENVDVSRTRRILRRMCRPIVYAEPVSHVYSLYFDDPRLSACLANIDGIGYRHKTRLRWYDQPAPTDRFFFETKWRKNQAVGKRRMQLVAGKLDTKFSLREFHRQLCDVLPADRLDYLPQDTDAVTVVQYKREHFALDGTSIRLTLDYDLRFSPLLGRTRYGTRFPHRMPGLSLIECKTEVGQTSPIYSAIAPLGVRQDRFSKYVAACSKLGYATRI